ncbi:MAG: tripartite tricarboxylate transporter substrate binding protein [Burkholderiales bacterium]
MSDRDPARRRFAGLAVLMFAATTAHAQPYPSKSIDIVVPYAPGGTTDFVTRLIGQKLSEAWGQPVVVVNKPGASGALGADLAAQAAGDGYTLLVTGYTNRNLLFAPTPPTPNPAKDVIPVALVGKAPLLLLAHPEFRAKTLRELIAAAKSEPGKLSYASIGNGSPSHLAMEMLRRAAGIDMTHVPYKGSGPALQDLIAGHVPLMMDSVVSSSPHVKAGKLRAIGVTTSARLASLPDVPTLAESGLPGFDAFTWTALYVPAGTPADRIEKLRAEVARILSLPDIRERYASQGAIVPEPMTTGQVASFISADIVGWRKVIQDGAIKAD